MKNLMRAGLDLARKAQTQDDREQTDALETKSNLAQHGNRPKGRPMNPGVPVAALGRRSRSGVNSGRKSRKSQVRL